MYVSVKDVNMKEGDNKEVYDPYKWRRYFYQWRGRKLYPRVRVYKTITWKDMSKEKKKELRRLYACKNCCS